MHNNNLFELRTRRDLTQKEFADRAGINAGVYSRYERGETDIPLSVAKKIAVTYGVSIDFIAMYSISEQGIKDDEDIKVIQETIFNPLVENEGNKTEALKAFVKSAEQQMKTFQMQISAVKNEIDRMENTPEN